MFSGRAEPEGLCQLVLPPVLRVMVQGSDGRIQPQTQRPSVSSHQLVSPGLPHVVVYDVPQWVFVPVGCFSSQVQSQRSVTLLSAFTWCQQQVGNLFPVRNVEDLECLTLLSDIPVLNLAENSFWGWQGGCHRAARRATCCHPTKSPSVGTQSGRLVVLKVWAGLSRALWSH